MNTVKEQTGAGAGEVLDFLYLDPSDIIVTDHRMRKEFADTLELQEELKVSPGLLTAPFVNLNNQLICGEHRYRAMCAILEFGGRFYHQGQLVPEGKIPVQRASSEPLSRRAHPVLTGNHAAWPASNCFYVLRVIQCSGTTRCQ